MNLSNRYYPQTFPLPAISEWEFPWKFHDLVGKFLVFLAKLLSGATTHWIDNAPTAKPRVYIGNHSSHLDFLLLWSSLPGELRRITRPVAGSDYWQRGKLRRYLITNVFHSIVINRQHVTQGQNPLTPLHQALQRRQSIILFPEGTRSRDGMMHDFKSGIYHLAKKMPQVEFVPVYIWNANRILPKGEWFPVPMLCSVTFGAPFTYQKGTDRQAFLTHAQQAVLQLQHVGGTAYESAI